MIKWFAVVLVSLLLCSSVSANLWGFLFRSRPVVGIGAADINGGHYDFDYLSVNTLDANYLRNRYDVNVLQDVNIFGNLWLSGDLNVAGNYFGNVTKPTDFDVNKFLAREGLVDFSENLSDVIHTFNGMVLETIDGDVTSDGVTITFSLEQSGGGDLNVFFEDDFFNIDTTPATTVSLTAGSDTSPQQNFVYIPRSTLTLTKSTTGFPSAEHAPIATIIVQSASTVQSDGALKVHFWTDHTKGTDNQGHVSHINEWIREQHSTWIDGVAQTLTITTNVGVPDDVDFATTAGNVFQLHPHAVPAFNTVTGTKVYTVNDSVAAYNQVFDLNELLTDSVGGSMLGKYFNLVLWASVSEKTVDSQLFVNLPSGSYIKEGDATGDVSGYTNFSIPSDFKGAAFLISRLTLRHQVASGGTWTSIQEIDLRGQIPNIVAGGGTSAITTEFSDNAFKLFDESDATKELQFQLFGITTGSTRTLTVPDNDGNILISNSQGDVNILGDLNLLGGDLNAGDANFQYLEADKFFGDGSGLTGIVAGEPLDTTLDTNGAADLNWLGTQHKFTADQNFVDIGLSGSAYIDNNINASSGIFNWVDKLEQITDPPIPPVDILRLYVEDINGFSFYSYLDSTGMKRKLVRDSVILVKNIRGSAIAANRIVYATGSEDKVPTIDLADASDAGKMPAICVTVETIADGAFGRCMQVGLLENINTSSLSEGNILYVSETTPGTPTTTIPLVPSFEQEIGTVLVSDAVVGAIQVVARGMNQNARGTSNSFTVWYDLNVVGDANIMGDLNVLGDTNLLYVQADKFFGDGSGLTGVLTYADANNHYVPYIDADFDVNLGVYGLTANDLNAMNIGIGGTLYSQSPIIMSSDTNTSLSTFFIGEEEEPTYPGWTINAEVEDTDLTNFTIRTGAEYWLVMGPAAGGGLYHSMDIGPSGADGIIRVNADEMAPSTTAIETKLGTPDRIWKVVHTEDLNAVGDINAVNIGLSKVVYGGNTNLDLNIVNDVYFDDDVNVLKNIFVAGKYFGDGSGLSGILTYADANNHYVPYIDADFDVNLGAYRLKASDINAQLVTGVKFKSDDANSVLGDDGIAFGLKTTAFGSQSSAFGETTTAIGDWSFATGVDTIAEGDATFTAGNAAVASGANSVAMGQTTTASGTHSMAMGLSTQATGNYSTTFGESTIASGQASTALGESTEASGWTSTTMGDYSKATASYSTAIGFWPVASGQGSIAGGYGDTGKGPFAIGDGAIALGYSDSNMVAGSAATHKGAVSLGYNARSFAEAAITLGKDLNNFNANSVRLNDLNAAGDANFQGSVQATAFYGSGAGLTGITGGCTTDCNMANLGISGALFGDNANGDLNILNDAYFGNTIYGTGAENYGIDLSEGTWNTAAINVDQPFHVFSDGTRAMYFNDADSIAVFGMGDAGNIDSITTGSQILAIGSKALRDVTSGGNLVAIGTLALSGATSARNSIGIGASTGGSITTGQNDIAIGTLALNNVPSGTLRTIGIGVAAARYAASDVTAIGDNAGIGNAGGAYYRTTTIGAQSGYNNLGSDDSIFIGYKAGYNQTFTDDLLIIDNQDRDTNGNEEAESLIYGKFDNDKLQQTLRLNTDVNITNDLNVLGKTKLTGDANIVNIGMTGNFFNFNSLGDANIVDMGMSGSFYGFNAVGDSNIVNIGMTGNFFSFNALGDANVTDMAVSGFLYGDVDLNVMSDTYFESRVNIQGDLNVTSSTTHLTGVSIESDANRICFPSEECQFMLDWNGQAFVMQAG